jgi:hypothetical protein
VRRSRIAEFGSAGPEHVARRRSPGRRPAAVGVSACGRVYSLSAPRPG